MPSFGGQQRPSKKNGGKKEGKPRKPKGKEDTEGWKKCNTCKKFKELTEYHDRQASCKLCYGNLKALRRTCEIQGMSDWFTKLPVKAPGELEELVKQFGKERQETARNRKINFSVSVFREMFRSQCGIRIARCGEMMHKSEYLTHPAGPKKGYLSGEEAELRWLEMLQESKEGKRKVDYAGPHRCLRLWVKVRDEITEYDDAHKVMPTWKHLLLHLLLLSASESSLQTGMSAAILQSFSKCD